MPAVLTQVADNPGGSGCFADTRRFDRIGKVSPACITDGCYMVDVDG
jgi:hypothetical protein